MIKIPLQLPKAIAWLVRHARLCTLSFRSARRRCGTAYRFAGMARGEPTDRGHRRQGKLLGEFRCRFQPRARRGGLCRNDPPRSEEHTSELQSLMRISYAVFCLKKNTYNTEITQAKSTH